MKQVWGEEEKGGRERGSQREKRQVGGREDGREGRQGRTGGREAWGMIGEIEALLLSGTEGGWMEAAKGKISIYLHIYL